MSVSLVITILNERDNLAAWAKTVDCQTVRPDEVVICDGGSTDGSVELLEEWAATTEFDVVLISVPGANISEGRNAAIAAASHPWIAVTDAGTTLEPTWLGALLNRTQSADVVSGFFFPSGRTRFERLLATMITFRLEEINPHSFLPSSRSLLIKKSAWEEVGGYPEWLDYCEDLVFDLSLKSQGLQFAFQGEALVSWSARSTIPAFFKQYYRYARGDGKADLWRGRHAVRYGVYVAGIALVVLMTGRYWWFPAAIVLGWVAYHSRYLLRISKSDLPVREKIPALIAAPFLGTVGDVAKMVGYPVGLRWRSKNRDASRWR